MHGGRDDLPANLAEARRERERERERGTGRVGGENLRDVLAREQKTMSARGCESKRRRERGDNVCSCYRYLYKVPTEQHRLSPSSVFIPESCRIGLYATVVHHITLH